MSVQPYESFMASSRLFYKYYDTLFASKDYKGEVDAVLSYSSSCIQSPIRDILEVGCGTGSHTVELAKISNINVSAVDIDPAMLELAKSKVIGGGATNVTFSLSINEKGTFDLSVALFNVVNYLRYDEDLFNFFISIINRLRTGGIFIFDCWNGAAALADPPGSKNYEQQSGDVKVCCILTSQTDIREKITTLNYQLELLNRSGAMVDSGCHQLFHKLWTPVQVEKMLLSAGFQVKLVCLPFRFDQAATERDWKIMFVCMKR